MNIFKKEYFFYKKKHLRRISFFLLCIFLTITFFFIVKKIKQEKKEYKKAIIIVPGIGGSELFYNGNDNKDFLKRRAIFFPNEFSFFNINQFIEDIETVIKNSAILECDKQGIPINKNVGLFQDISIATKEDTDLHKYGLNYIHKDLINILNSKFGESTIYNQDIILFNYDWRLSCATNGNLLTKLIQKYDSVSLIGFSMGGLISCKAMCNLYKKSQLNKIKNYISVCVPYNGAVLTLYALSTGLVMESAIMNFFYQNLECDKIVKKLLKNYPSIYELLPTKQYFAHSKGYLKNESGKLLNYPETIDYIKNNFEVNNTLLNNAILFHKSLFIKQKHILEYLRNKYFFVGSGYKAISELENSKSLNISGHKNGDETVELENSAIPPIEDIKNLNIYKIKSIHVKILNNKEFLSQLINILENNFKKNL